MNTAVITEALNEAGAELRAVTARMDAREAERAALDAVGYAGSPLWLALEAPGCAACGESIRRGAVQRGSRRFPYFVCPKCALTHPEQHEDDDGRYQSAGEMSAALVRGPL